MELTPDFQFSQASLQDLSDCHRRFFLRYIRRLAWPAVESQPIQENETRQQQGTAFHRMVQQYFLGIPEQRLSELNLEEPLQGWWQNFLRFKRQLPALGSPDAKIYPECTLTTSVAGVRLVAKFDLVVIQGRKVSIYDWKTARHQPKRDWLQRRLQSLVYPYVMFRSGGYLAKDRQPFSPEEINLTYWFVEFPDHPENFNYSRQQMETESAYLESQVKLVKSKLAEDETSFPLTPDEKTCTLCTFRSLCNRGARAGENESLDEAIDLSGLVIDPDQIAEIEF